jgi:leucyl/phenylalanyl-tRNA---protein transferase
MRSITPEIVLQAYSAGLFPMAERADDPVLHWVEPEERGILPLDRFHVPTSLRKSIRHSSYQVKINSSFETVIRSCAEPTSARPSTWINGRIIDLYCELHRMGHAHSIEAWSKGRLAGGLYGIVLGGAFFGESMFSRQTNASKIALVHLVARLKAGRFRLLDAQFMNKHLVQFGAHPISRAHYRNALREALTISASFDAFRQDDDPNVVIELAHFSAIAPS